MESNVQLKSEIRKIVAELCNININTIKGSDIATDLSIESIEMCGLAEYISRKIKIEIDISLINNHTTIYDLERLFDIK